MNNLQNIITANTDASGRLDYEAIGKQVVWMAKADEHSAERSLAELPVDDPRLPYVMEGFMPASVITPEAL